jgi:hypothetical protein
VAGDNPGNRDKPSLELPSFIRRKRASGPTAAGRRSHPRVGALPAALVTGSVVGLLTVGLVWLALRGCSSLRGTSTCGDPGLLVLVAIFVVMTYVGRALLRAWQVPDPGSTSFLAMALVAVMALLFVDDLDSTVSSAMLAVLAAGAYGLSQWVTSTFVEPGDRPR